MSVEVYSEKIQWRWSCSTSFSSSQHSVRVDQTTRRIEHATVYDDIKIRSVSTFILRIRNFVNAIAYDS